MKKQESQFENRIESVGERGMRFREGHPICKECLDGSCEHDRDPGQRHDCKNVDKIEGEKNQCHCGFGGVYDKGRDSWEEWPEDWNLKHD